MSETTPAAGRAGRIRTQLERSLRAQSVELIDDSHLHAGHADEGKGHFRVRVVSTHFEGLRALQRHQLVFRSLGEIMQTDIHALSITALTPQEAQRAAS